MKKLFFRKSISCTFSVFKQLPLNTKQKFEFPYHLIDGEKLLSIVIGAVRFSTEKSLDFHDTIILVSPSLSKVQ